MLKMKNIFCFGLLLMTLLACKKEEKQPIEKSEASDLFKKDTIQVNTYVLAEMGDDLFHGKANCATCHQIEEKVIGPSIKEIVSIYKSQDASIVNFLKGNHNPIVDKTKYDLMKPYVEMSKNLSDEEIQALSDYMFSVSEKYTFISFIYQYDT